MVDVPQPVAAATPARDHDFRVWISFIVGLAFFVFLVRIVDLDFSASGLSVLMSLGLLFVIFLFSALVAFAARQILAQPRDPHVAMAADADALRSRIAPLILALGAGAIVILSLGIILAFSLISNSNTNVSGNIDTLIMGVFTAVLPVLATWVGTVLAFYFTNESYKQAAETSRAAARVTPPERRPVADRMIPYEKIAKDEADTREAADAIKMDKLFAMMSPPVTRVIVFEKGAQNPIYIIRKKLIPEAWTQQAGPWPQTISDYRKLDGGRTGSDSTNFGFVSPNASVEEVREIMQTTNTVDVFVSRSGQKNEPILGWLTDDLVKG